MICMLCSGNITTRTDDYVFNSKAVGNVIVPKIKFEVCDQCGEMHFSASEGKKILDYVKGKEDKAIRSFPVRDFVTADQAATILGRTKQAFSKNKKIQRGFIFNTIIGNKKLYLKKSVEQFKETENGIFMLKNKLGYDDELTATSRKTFERIAKIYPPHGNESFYDLSSSGYADSLETETPSTIH